MMTYTGTSEAEIEERRLRPLPAAEGAVHADRRDAAAAASSRCWRWPVGWRPIRRCCILDELSMGLAPIIVEELYEIVAQVATRGRVDPRGRAVRQHSVGRGRLRGHHGARPDRTRRVDPNELRDESVQAYLGGMTGDGA